MSENSGFKINSLEKVYRLMTILGEIDGHPEISDALALKGGTAIQGLAFGFRRLSIDIDFNFIGSVDKDVTQEKRESIREIIGILAPEMKYELDLRSEYALDQYQWKYDNVYGTKDYVKVEINYLERLPLIQTSKFKMDHSFDGLGDVMVHSYPPEELFAGKVRALLTRGSARDVYDAHLIYVNLDRIDQPLFKKLSTIYLVMHHNDARKISTKTIANIDKKSISDTLLPMVKKSEVERLGPMVDNAKKLAEYVLTFSPEEQNFLDTFYDEQRIDTDQLLSGSDIKIDLTKHPSIAWRLKEMERLKQNN